MNPNEIPPEEIERINNIKKTVIVGILQSEERRLSYSEQYKVFADTPTGEKRALKWAKETYGDTMMPFTVPKKIGMVHIQMTNTKNSCSLMRAEVEEYE